MAINIAKHIGELLYDHDTVIIPALGAIAGTYESASIDHVQGLLHPPSKVLSFNKNLVLDDGVLTNYLQAEAELSLAEAQAAIHSFVEETKRSLAKREIVVFPKVGRLYKDYENKLQFLQDSTNFNTAVYGLPTIQFYPILRSSEALAEKQQRAAQVHDTVRRPRAAKQLKRYALPALLVVAVLAVLISVYSIQKGSDGTPFTPSLKVKVNTSPLDSEVETFEETQTTIDLPISEDGEYASDIDTESITTAPNQKEAVIIVGAFRKKEGIKKSIKEIYALGYAPYQDKKSNLTRIGVQLAYDDPKELATALATIRRKITNRAWILK